MNISIKKGLSYGLTSGVITTLGLLIGLYFSGASKNVILAGILTIAFADAFSDGLGMHISEESENQHTDKEIWESTVSTIMAKMVFALTFILPLLLLPLLYALIFDIFWGIFLLSVLCLYISKQNKEKMFRVLFEHMGIAIIVVVGSFIIGSLISRLIS
jgi:VIT1/CCC1 family predicted Fe2+/Mn2+ transporter